MGNQREKWAGLLRSHDPPFLPEDKEICKTKWTAQVSGKEKAMTEAPIQGEKTHTKSEKRRAEDSAGCDGIKTSTERCRKCKESNPLPHCIFFIPSKTPNPLLSSVTEWKIGVLTRTLSFMAFESDSAHYSESLFAGGPDLDRPRPSVFFETQDVCSTRNLSGPPPFPCHVSWGLFKCLTRVKDGQIHCEMSGVEKKYIPDTKKI